MSFNEPDRYRPIELNEAALDRVNEALCRFVFPGAIVPRSEMARACLIAAAGYEEWREHLPARTVARMPTEYSEDVGEILDAVDHHAERDMDHDLHAIVEHYRNALNLRAHGSEKADHADI